MNQVVTFRLARVAAIYLVLASFALTMTRYGGGVAFLWPATPYLVAELNAASRRAWLPIALTATVASIAATGLFGFGWEAALPMAAANMAEAFIAAYFLRSSASGSALSDLSWFGRFATLIVVFPSLVSSTIAATVGALLHKSVIATYTNFFVGHSLSTLTLAPILILLFDGELLKFARQAQLNRLETVLCIGLSFSATVLCFVQNEYPLLFLPVLPIILATFRLGRGGTIVCILFLTFFGGAATLRHMGPLQLVAADAGVRIQLFQFYLAMTVLTAWPVAADLSRRSRLHRILRQSEEQYRMIAEHSSDILMQISHDGTIQYVSPSITTLAGYAPLSLVGHNALDLVDSLDRNEMADFLARTLDRHEETHAREYRGTLADGDTRWFDTHSRAILDDAGRVEGALSIIRDVTARKLAEEKLSLAAVTDPLTGVPNRRGWFVELERRLNLAQGSSTPSCIAILDIDHFKRVNDNYGHEAGDMVLQQCAKLARDTLRACDYLARIGGEEFVVFFDGLTLFEARAACEKLRTTIAGQKIRMGGSEVAVTVSGGVACLEGHDVEKAMRLADTALYAAKRDGRDRLALAA